MRTSPQKPGFPRLRLSPPATAFSSVWLRPLSNPLSSMDAGTFPKKCDSFLHKKLYFFSKTGTFLKKTIPCPQGSGLANACDSFSIGKTVLFSKTRMFLKKTIPCPARMLELFPKKNNFFFDFFHVFLHRNQLLRCRQKTAHPLFICQ